MRHILHLVPLLLASCFCSPQQVEPAARTAGELRAMFDREQAVNRALVEASNPQPATLQVYIAAQGETRQAFMAVYNAHLGHLASLAQVDPQTLTKIIEAATPLVK